MLTSWVSISNIKLRFFSFFLCIYVWIKAMTSIVPFFCHPRIFLFEGSSKNIGLPVSLNIEHIIWILDLKEVCKLYETKRNDWHIIMPCCNMEMDFVSFGFFFCFLLFFFILFNLIYTVWIPLNVLYTWVWLKLYLYLLIYWLLILQWHQYRDFY